MDDARTFSSGRRPMTSRVFDFRGVPSMEVAARVRPRQERSRSRSGVGTATVIAALVVPLAGAAQRPGGFIAAAVSAGVVLGLALGFGHRLPWGWLSGACAIAG